MTVISTSKKPIFCATHPRACSTAFERVFMTRRDVLSCVHEPFGDAFYYGPERLGVRYADDADARESSGFANTTYADVLQTIEESSEGVGFPISSNRLMMGIGGFVLKLRNANSFGAKRIFIKDIIHYLFPPSGAPASIAPSLGGEKSTEPNNPTVIPVDILRKFQFTFLIRHPRRSIPSYFRCTVPPLDKVTGFYNFDPAEAGYDEVRRFFDFLLKEGLIDRSNLTVVDADDLLDDPEGILRAYCKRVGLDFHDGMLNWSDDDTAFAQDKFAKWVGFHDDALSSCNLRARDPKHKKVFTRESEDREWNEKYGEKGAKLIRQTVEDNLADYEYLKKFALSV
ncbi:conserved hypothetical protein [Verticillium alfalfae VaMs.102]|uniref:Uncharacterized protein n=1 Tax=Verticillium alfalfae (strain VaMs.102 / ATCC MYA-4576 / FGSC 10136) TaxID=526221 RepID=C9SPD5_VERA1|nr:conserved hypothetical protein [Verticillium alfalfae VaMs.102]EEY20650.1 conserved hypothetical protein [Verticillium alfalfae VaMs.102]